MFELDLERRRVGKRKPKLKPQAQSSPNEPAAHSLFPFSRPAQPALSSPARAALPLSWAAPTPQRTGPAHPPAPQPARSAQPLARDRVALSHCAPDPTSQRPLSAARCPSPRRCQPGPPVSSVPSASAQQRLPRDLRRDSARARTPKSPGPPLISPHPGPCTLSPRPSRPKP